MTITRTRRVSPENKDAAALENAIAQQQWWEAGRTSRPFGVPSENKTGNATAEMGALTLCDPTRAAFTIWLPTIEPGDIGGFVAIKNNSASANQITVQAKGDTTIDGITSIGLVAPRQGLIAVAVSKTEWAIVSAW